jgi:hypothetical protein
MTITYTEFDTTPAGLIAALKAAILGNSHWSDQGVVAVTTTSTGATTAAGTTVALTSAAGFTVGAYLTAGVGTANENSYLITAVAGNVVTVSGIWGFIFPSGNTFKTRNTVLKSTSDRGADLIVDLEGGATSQNLNSINLSVYRQYTGTAPGGQTDAKSYWLTYKVSSGIAAMPIHVTLSVGKNHLFVSVEGPRANETSTQNTTYGSVKNYFAICDLIPYHAADTVPAAIGIGVSSSSPPAVTNNAHQVHISRDAANTVSWAPGRLGTLDWPTLGTTDVVTLNRTCTIDGKTYLFPYVVASETEGLRGRLSAFFYCGTTAPTTVTDFPESVGSKVTYDGIVYKLLAVNKGDNANVAWGPFGTSANSVNVTRSIVVAVPFAVAV